MKQKSMERLEQNTEELEILEQLYNEAQNLGQYDDKLRESFRELARQSGFDESIEVQFRKEREERDRAAAERYSRIVKNLPIEDLKGNIGDHWKSNKSAQ